MDRKQNFLCLFPLHIRELLTAANLDFESLREIRLRAGQPILLMTGQGEWTILRDGSLSANYRYGVRIPMAELSEILDYLCGSSVYAYEEELKKGYLTVPGGHRIGLGGSVSLENGLVKTYRYISSMNIRVAHEIKGAADWVYPYLHTDSSQFYNTLIISAPGLGKTTLLRDIVRHASNEGFQVCVIDERSEVAGCYMGLAQNDLGLRTDVLDNCRKAEGMMMAVRTMSPAVIAVDEIGSVEDVQAVRAVLRSGCSIVATVHGEAVEDIRKKPAMSALIEERVFERCIVLRCAESKKEKDGSSCFHGIQRTVLDAEGIPIREAVYEEKVYGEKV